MKVTVKYLLLILYSAFISSCNIGDQNPSVKKTEDTTLLITQMNKAYYNHEYLKALNYLEILIAYDSTNGEYYFKKGYCESGLLNMEESTYSYKKAIKFNFRIKSAYYNIGTNYLLTSDSLAKLYFEKALVIDPNYDRAKNQLMLLKNK